LHRVKSKKGETKGNNVITPRKGIKVDWITDELHGNDILPFRNFFFSVFTQFFLFLTLVPKSSGIHPERSTNVATRVQNRCGVGWMYGEEDGSVGQRVGRRNNQRGG
jgi:hypothetical protein